MKTLFIGQNAIYVKSLASTNSYASELMRQISVADGTIIYTFEQKKGRGQRGNSWESEPNKNVTLSLVLHPQFLTVEDQFLLTKIAALAIADLMAELLNSSASSHRICIKWPNDVYVDDKKIAGILIENFLREHTIQSSVIGIGINVNQAHFAAAPNATSVYLLTGKTMELKECIDLFCQYAEVRYLQLKANKLQKLSDDYLQHLYRLNEWNIYTSVQEPAFQGKIKGVSKMGKLLLERKSGELNEFDMKEIGFQ